jgi:hypothetical protein
MVNTLTNLIYLRDPDGNGPRPPEGRPTLP